MKKENKQPVVFFLMPAFPDDAVRRAYTPPLGPLQLASILRQHGYSVDLLDPLLDQLSIDQVKDLLSRKPFDVLCLSGFSNNYWFIKEISRFLRDQRPEVPILAGGPLAASSPEHLLTHTAVDACALGEGETIIIDLVSRSLCGGDLSEIASIAYRDKTTGEVHVSPQVLRTTDLDALPLPAYDLVDLMEYSKNRVEPCNLKQYCREFNIDPDTVSPIMPIQTQRGCPFSCHFCSKDYGRKLVRHSVDHVIAHLDYLNETYGYNHFKFIDDAFNIPHKWVLEFCERIKKHDKQYFFWTSGTRADFITEEQAVAMKQAGIYQVNIGIESFNQNVLDEMNKHLKLEKILQAMDILDGHGLISKDNCALLYGWPSDSLETMRNNLSYIRKYELNRLGVYYPCPFPGTVLYDWAVKAGKIPDLEGYLMKLSTHNLNDMLINLSSFTDEELKRVVERAAEQVDLWRWQREKKYLAAGYQFLKMTLRQAIPKQTMAYQALRRVNRRVKSILKLG